MGLVCQPENNGIQLKNHFEQDSVVTESDFILKRRRTNVVSKKGNSGFTFQKQKFRENEPGTALVDAPPKSLKEYKDFNLSCIFFHTRRKNTKRANLVNLGRASAGLEALLEETVGIF